MRDDTLNNPEVTDFHGRKRELLRLGVDQGRLSWDDIRAALPENFLGDAELEVFLFTCRNMGIEISGLPHKLSFSATAGEEE